MYGKKEGKFNIGKGTKNIKRELDPKKFGVRQEKERTLFQKEKREAKVRKLLQCVSIKGTLYSNANCKVSVVDKTNLILKEFNRLHISLAYEPVHNIYSYYDETRNQKMTREKITFYYLVEEDRVVEIQNQLDKYIKYLDSVEISSK